VFVAVETKKKILTRVIAEVPVVVLVSQSILCHLLLLLLLLLLQVFQVQFLDNLILGLECHIIDAVLLVGMVLEFLTASTRGWLVRMRSPIGLVVIFLLLVTAFVMSPLVPKKV